MAVFGPPNPTDRAAFDRRWTRILAADDVIVRTILVGDEVAGHILLWRDPELEGPEVSYWVRRTHWGRGVATQALAEFLRQVPQRPLFGRAAVTNVGSTKVLERNGFVLIAAHPTHAPDGTPVEEAVYRLGTPMPELALQQGRDAWTS